MRPFAVLFVASASLLSHASAEIVRVSVTGIARFEASGPLQQPNNGTSYGRTANPPELGNGRYTAVYTYDSESPLNSATSMSKGALRSFKLSFEGGSTFTATGGDLRASSGELTVSALTGAKFPPIATKNFSNFIVFKIVPKDTDRPVNHLPTAAEVSENYKPFFSWIGYGGNVNAFTLSGTGVFAIVEPLAPTAGSGTAAESPATIEPSPAKPGSTAAPESAPFQPAIPAPPVEPESPPLQAAIPVAPSGE